MTTTYHTLGYDDQYYRLKLDYNPKDGGTLAVSVDGQSQPWPRLVDALQKQLLVYSKGIGSSHYTIPTKRQKDGTGLIFRDVGSDFSVNLNTETIGTYRASNSGELTQTFYRPLTVGEVRRIGTFHNTSPYAQHAPDREGPENDALLARAKKAVFTDFHTHSSGHISPRGLLKVAVDHEAYYPLSLLRDAGIDTSFQRFPGAMRKSIPRVPFPPRDVPNMPNNVEAVPLRGLTNEERHKLEIKMAMPMDRQSTFSEMEHDAYRFRYPLTKDDKLLGDTLKQTARELMSQGIKHAELAMVGLDKPQMLKAVHQTMHEIENDPEFKGFSMQFMVGIPRNFTSEKIEELLEKTKILSQSPYITGVDFIGYEVTKTKEFADKLAQFCDWANENRSGFNVRVHAGENDKNLDNVRDFLELAQAHPNLHFRVGHGVHGMTSETLKLARTLSADPKNPRLTIESNPDSVIALNNIDCFTDIPFAKMVSNKIPFVIGSDSAGTYGTTAEQLGLAAYYGGLDDHGFELLETHQKHLMEQQRGYAKNRASTIADWKTASGKESFTDKLVAELATVPLAPPAEENSIDPELIAAKLRADEVAEVDDVKNVAELKHRTPVTIVGASGDRWEKLTPIAQREVAIGMDMLTHALNPDKAYFVQGRTKPSGLSYVVNKALHGANADLVKEGRNPFYNLGLLVAARFTQSDSYKHLTHMRRVSDKYLDLADEAVEHVLDNNGVLIAAGGSAFSRDIILKADQRGILDASPDKKRMMFLFSNASGASAEKSKVLLPDYSVENGITLIQKMQAIKPELFREGLTLDKLNTLYEQSAARVDEYGYDAPPEPSSQTVVDAETVAQKELRK